MDVTLAAAAWGGTVADVDVTLAAAWGGTVADVTLADADERLDGDNTFMAGDASALAGGALSLAGDASALTRGALLEIYQS